VDLGGRLHAVKVGIGWARLDVDLPTRHDAAMAADPLVRAAELARAFLAAAGDRPVGVPVDRDALRAALGGELPEHGEDPAELLERLAAQADRGIVATAGPRYFGFVVGGALPAAVGADWLTSAWDQNAGLYALSPAATVVEEIVGAWLTDLLGLPSSASVGLVTGGQMANTTCLAVARHAVLERAGWDVESSGLQGAPTVTVVIGDEAHASILTAFRMLGLGSQTALRVPVDGQGRMRAGELRRVLAGVAGPVIVCAQAGNVNTGACDPLAEVAEAARACGAWLHVDGAFGLWAAASERLAPLVAGRELADSWAVDGHKWLNVPQDTGFAICADRAAHRAALGTTAAYLQPAVGGDHDPFELVPEWSRRARGFPAYAALRSLGRRGAAELIERCCAYAAAMAGSLGAEDGVEVLNEVCLNQVLVRFGDDDARTRAVIQRVQQDGVAWLGGTVWQGRAAMRIAVSSHATTEQDARLTVEAILSAWRAT
jgi:glutamate/tyrosine decarboxylase-like PLP-dependent enzyme